MRRSPSTRGRSASRAGPPRSCSATRNGCSRPLPATRAVCSCRSDGTRRAAGGSLIVVDPRLSTTARAATLHLRLTPGTDAALANGLLHLLIRDGFVDEEYVARRTEGFGPVKALAATYWPELVERITGVP